MGLVALLLLGLAAGITAFAQTSPVPAAGLTPDWRRIGNSSIEASLAAPATGQVDRVWFAQDGAGIFIRTHSGRYFESRNLEGWIGRPELQAPGEDLTPALHAAWLPDPISRVRAADGFFVRLYAFGRQVYRSEDGGQHWTDLTGFRGRSIIGDGFLDLSVSPIDPDVVVAVNKYGVWRSADGGLSWSGLNDGLPNLPVQGLLETPAGSRGTKILLEDNSAWEWAPGEKLAWRPAADTAVESREAARRNAAAQTGAQITAVALGGERSYAGSADGGLWVSSDQGENWRWSRQGSGGAVDALFTVPGHPEIAVATLAGPAGEPARPRVLRTLDGGIVWEDLTGDLPPSATRGVALDMTGSAVYVATDRGVFLSLPDPGVGRPAGRWMPMSENLPPVPVIGVMLDEAGNQIYVALDGYGVYAAPAPHRFWNLQVVSSADFGQRPAAPGSLLTVLGGRLVKAQAGLIEVPVLHAADGESQIQIPFEVTGSSTLLSLELPRGQLSVTVALQEVSPAIFVDRDGSALLLDGDSGVLLDARTPARSNTRVQILATGLGRVSPSWPTGRSAPVREPPNVIAPVSAFLNRTALEVTRATLAPGYVGFYLVEVRLPSLVDYGPAELYLEAEGHESNRVRIYLEP